MSEATVTQLTPDSNGGNTTQAEFKELTATEVEKLEPKERLDYLNNLIQVKQERVLGSTYPLYMPSAQDDPNGEYSDMTKYYQSLQRFIQTKMKWGGKSAIANNKYYQFIEIINIYDWITDAMATRKNDELIEFRYDLFEILYTLMLHQDGVGYDDAKKHMYLFRPVNNAFKNVDNDIQEINNLYQQATQLNSELSMNNEVDYAQDEAEYQKEKTETKTKRKPKSK